MCTNGVNTGQLEQMIEQVDDHVKLERRWAHTLGHLAGDAGFATVPRPCSTMCARCSARRKTPSRTMPLQPATSPSTWFRARR